MRTRTKVMLDGEHTRRVLIFALWRIASANIVGEHDLSEAVYDKAWAGIHTEYMPDGDVAAAEHRLIRLGSVQRAVRAASRAKIGDTLELPVAPEEMDDAMRDFLLALDQNDELRQAMPEEEQEDIALCRGAAAQVLWELGEALNPTAPRPPEFAEPPKVYRQEPLHDGAAMPSNYPH